METVRAKSFDVPAEIKLNGGESAGGSIRATPLTTSESVPSPP
jgi:hypothetical protein